MRAWLSRAAVVWLLSGALWAAPDFPELTGRVVDTAGFLDAGQERALGSKLASHEERTGNQVVVVTLPDLQGYTIETYGYQLGRHWGIGQAEQDNGVLLIVARQERKVRIEVGYGLEGTLTDALSSSIIQGAILPQFRRGDFAGGIEQGVEGILVTLEGGAQAMGARSGEQKQRGLRFMLLILGVLIIVPFVLAILSGAARPGPPRGPGTGYWGGYGGGSGGGFGGGGFGGGGGGFGGGGASGGW